MKKQRFKYVGDAAFERFLQKHDCPTPFHNVDTVRVPASARLDEFTGLDRRCFTDDCHQISVTTDLHSEDAEPRVYIVEGHPLD